MTATSVAVAICVALISFGCSTGDPVGSSTPPQPVGTAVVTTVPAEPAATQTTPAATTAPTTGTTIGDQPLTLRGMGGMVTGMTLPEIEAELGLAVVSFTDDGLPCQYGYLDGDPNSPQLMVIAEEGVFPLGKVLRIELNESQSTRSGIRIGSTKADVLAAYGDQIVATPHKYTFAEGGEYLTFVPQDSADADYRLVMETENDIVTQIRSGVLPYVEFVEGCS